MATKKSPTKTKKRAVKKPGSRRKAATRPAPRKKAIKRPAQRKKTLQRSVPQKAPARRVLGPRHQPDAAPALGRCRLHGERYREERRLLSRHPGFHREGALGGERQASRRRDGCWRRELHAGTGRLEEGP